MESNIFEWILCLTAVLTRKILNRILELRTGHRARRVVKGRMSSPTYATISPQVFFIQ